MTITNRLCRSSFQNWMKCVDLRANSTALGKAWTGEAFGWPAEYHAERPEPPLDSKLPFTPADFCIGESGVWFFSLMWEHGKDAPPVEFLDDRDILAETAPK